MTEPTLSHVKCLSPRGLHRLAYWEWGPADAPVLLVNDRQMLSFMSNDKLDELIAMLKASHA